MRFAQLLEMDPLDADQKDSVGHSLTSGAHLLTLIDRILAVSAAEPEDLNFLETSHRGPGRAAESSTS